MQSHQSLHFPGEKFFQDILRNFLLVNDLDGHFALEAVAVGSFHFAIGAFSKSVTKAVALLLKHHSIHPGRAAGTCPSGSCSASCAAGLCSTPDGAARGTAGRGVGALLGDLINSCPGRIFWSLHGIAL